MKVHKEVHCRTVTRMTMTLSGQSSHQHGGAARLGGRHVNVRASRHPTHTDCALDDVLDPTQLL